MVIEILDKYQVVSSALLLDFTIQLCNSNRLHFKRVSLVLGLTGVTVHGAGSKYFSTSDFRFATSDVRLSTVDRVTLKRDRPNKTKVHLVTSKSPPKTFRL